MEPRTSTPAARLRAVQALAEAGVLVGVATAPIIPGLNDSEIPSLLAAAKAGSQDAFAGLVEPFRRELLAHCYRMLGSNADAEDALQDSLLRAWSGLTRFEGRSSLRSWLYRIATNACLRAIERRPTRVSPIDFSSAWDPHSGPADAVHDPIWFEPFPDEAFCKRYVIELCTLDELLPQVDVLTLHAPLSTTTLHLV